MEWIETTGKTVEEAKQAAAEALGVAVRELEVEVLEEPKPGLFGWLRGEARIRARVKPRAAHRPAPRAPGRSPRSRNQQRRPSASGPRRNVNSRTRRRPAQRTRPAAQSPSRRTPVSWSDLGEEAIETVKEAGTKFLQGLGEAVGGRNISVACSGPDEDDILRFELNGEGLAVLVGQRGTILQAVHELLKATGRTRINREVGRVSLDIAGYRKKRTEALIEFARKVAQDVLATGKPKALEPMNPSDRRVVHNAILEIEGVTTFSKGEDPYRYVVIAPAPVPAEGAPASTESQS